MKTFTLSDGRSYRGVLAQVRINKEEYRSVLILAVSRHDAKTFSEFDRALRLNEALLRMFADGHPELTGNSLTAKFNLWEPTADDIDEAAFRVDQRIIRTDGLRELVNGEIHCYYSPRLSRMHNGAPTLISFTPKEQRETEFASVSDNVTLVPEF